MRPNTLSFVGMLLVAAGLLYIGIQLTNNANSTTSSIQGMVNTITVAGEGKSNVVPDTMLVNISVSEIASGSTQAQEMADEKIAQVREILKKQEIPTEKIKTENLSIYPEYNWTESRGQQIIGYRATQTLSVRIVGQDYQSKGENIIKQVSTIDGVQIMNTSFIVDDMEAARLGARSEAFNNAKEKAEQLAKLAGLKLGKASMITDQTMSNYPGPIYYARGAMEADMAMNEVQSTQINPGETEVMVNLQVVFELR